jgi:hypothetical protein
LSDKLLGDTETDSGSHIVGVGVTIGVGVGVTADGVKLKSATTALPATTVTVCEDESKPVADAVTV